MAGKLPKWRESRHAGDAKLVDHTVELPPHSGGSISVRDYLDYLNADFYRWKHICENGLRLDTWKHLHDGDEVQLEKR